MKLVLKYHEIENCDIVLSSICPLLVFKIEPDTQVSYRGSFQPIYFTLSLSTDHNTSSKAQHIH